MSHPQSISDRSGNPTVSLVIPARNAARTVRRCLDSVVPMLQSGFLTEILCVDDGSVDATCEIASSYPITTLVGKGEGPGAARNLGWRAARGDLVWFIDSDCVAHSGSLAKLLAQFDSSRIAGVGGSYSNLYPESLVATLIHEEIVARHRRMESEVNFLATFNVVYRRSVLEEVRGFDESLKLAQDAELAYRIRDHGYRLRFESESVVAHHHPTSLRVT